MMDAEKAGHLLAHLPRGAAQARFKRSFDLRARSALLNCGCTDAQIERLERILPGIAYYTEAGPRLVDVRALLANLAAQAHAADSALRMLLDAPEQEGARGEARLRLLEGLAKLYPDRCQIDPRRASFFHRYDEREAEARRLLAAIDDVVAAADHARERMPKAQTRAVAHPYPVALIDAAVNLDGPQVRPSASAASKFRRIADICYTAALGSTTTPLRAIREHLAAQQQP